MKESLHYNKLENNRVHCVLCPHNCILNNDQYGICNSRKNINGTLISTSYGNICSIGIDPVEKKPLMHYLPGTLTYSISSAGCNFRCSQCQNDNISQFRPEERTHFKLIPEQIIQEAIKNNCKSISYTYTEPTTFYEFMLDTSKMANSEGLKNIVVSNGYINEEPLVELCHYVHAFNIDLKYWNNETYKNISKGTLQPVLRTLEIIKEYKCWLEITNLIIPDVNDDLTEIEEMCNWLVINGFGNYPLHFSRFYPRFKFSNKTGTNLDIIFKARDIAKKAGINHIYLGNVPDEYTGLTKCKNCENVLIERYGYQLLQNNIELGKCKKCEELVDGVF